ncbi:MAG: ATP-dependent Clp protease proteolytic subunit [Candidatus Aquicultorales bacterium]
MAILGYEEVIVISTEDLTSDQAQGVIERLLEASGKDHRGILLLLNCYGGSSDAARAIIDIVQLLPDKIGVFAAGAAHSSAALILAAGSPGERYMSRTATIFLHETTGCQDDWQSGRVQLLEAEHTLWLDQTYESMLSRFTGQTAEKIGEWRKESRYIYAEEAVELGFADRIVDWPK